MKITFGKYAGRDIEALPEDYLIWMSDEESHPAIVRQGINWSELASQEWQRRKEAKRQEVEAAPAIFSPLPAGTYMGDIVRRLTPELVEAVRRGELSDLSPKSVEKMLSRAGYRMVSELADLILWAARAALSGRLPIGVSNDMQGDLLSYMDEQGNLHEERQRPRETFYW